MKSGEGRRLLYVVLLASALLAPSTTASAQTGMSYRFREDTLVGTTWVLGDNARRELETGENGLAAGRVEIWKDGGKQIFVLNTADRTYYELRAFRARFGLAMLSVEPLTVRSPFRVDRVQDVKVQSKLSLTREVSDGYPCHRALLTFSYKLTLRLDGVRDSLPGHVEGSLDMCLAEGVDGVRLPFGHGPELTSGHPEVDAAIAERFAPLKGIPVARILKVTRRIEKGDPVSATSHLLLSDVQTTQISGDRFEVPAGYRFKEPVITPPTRRQLPGTQSPQ
jgi:hypothetical protein